MTCGICEREEKTQLRHSGIAPVSYFACSECLERGAEPLEIVLLWIMHSGGLGTEAQLADRVISHHEGRYIGWEEVASIYPEREEELLKEASEETELIPDDDSTPPR